MILIFSDASIRHGVAGYCAIIVRDGRQDEILRGGIEGLNHSVAAEIAAVSIALNHLERSPHVLVSTDIDHLPQVMAEFDKRFISHSPTIRPQLLGLHIAIRRHEVVDFRVVSRSNERYRKCHQEAYRQAGKCARRAGAWTLD